MAWNIAEGGMGHRLGGPMPPVQPLVFMNEQRDHDVPGWHHGSADEPKHAQLKLRAFLRRCIDEPTCRAFDPTFDEHDVPLYICHEIIACELA
jgi:hypothetical protein